MSLEELEEAIVTGERPGPALWKVTANKGNTLWILPVFGPLPDGLNWKAKEVEEVIRVSQAVYIGGRQQGEGTRNVELANRAMGNENGQLLLDVLPPDVHEMFSELSRRFADGPSRFERYRPYYAVELLRDVAMTRLHLSSDGGVVAKVMSLAGRYKVKVEAIKALGNRERDRTLKQLDKTPRQADVPCVRVMLERMDAELLESIDRANEWSSGDVASLGSDFRFRSAAVYRDACKQFEQYLKSTTQQDEAARRTMYSTYTKALKRNKSTLALVAASDLLAADGLAAKLRKAGYAVNEPRTREVP